MLEELATVLLQKSQTPLMKVKKCDAVKKLAEELLIRYGIEYTEKQIIKKVHNLKNRVKAKTDLKQTGNKKINLGIAERKFFELMGGMENPTITERPCTSHFFFNF